jgi:paraquat-inducible protein B
MSPRTGRRLLGAFVLGAAALALVGAAALSSRGWFAEYRTYVVFFPYAVGGLKAGSPVTFRQVPVGQVRDVDLVFSGSEFHESRIMAVIEIRRGAFRNLAGRAPALADSDLARVLVDQGLRASVRSSSPIAGQKSVDLDFQPEQQPRLSGLSMRYPEIPSAPTGLEVLNEKLEATLKRLSDVPVDEVLIQLGGTLKTLQQILQTGDIPATLRRLRSTLDATTKTLAGAEQALGSADDIARDARSTLRGVDATMTSLTATLEQLNLTLSTVDRNVERTSAVQVEAGKTFDEASELMKAVRALVETLQSHPEALLRGKPEPTGKDR